MKKLGLILLGVLLTTGGIVLPAQAIPVVIDFNDAITDEYYSGDYIYEEDGFEMSGSFETVAFDNPDNYAFLRYSAFDYLEVARSDGGDFDFLSVEYLATAYQSEGFIASSNGGFYEFELDYELPSLLIFSGDEWSDLKWIRFERTGGLFHDLDNINVKPVPEPNTLMLLGTGLVLLSGYGRRKLRHR